MGESRRSTRRDERGAFAVMYALMVVMLLTIAALATDLGNAVSRKTDTQNQADFAAYSVGQKYGVDVASGATLTATSDVVKDVADYLNKNQPQDDSGTCDWRATNVTCVTPTQLVNGNLDDGEVRYANGGLQVVAPKTRVSFGFANVFGVGGTNVQSTATVNVFSAGPRIFPLMALDSSCGGGNYLDEGYTVVKETTGGDTPPPSDPVLSHATDDNATELTGITVFDTSNTEVAGVITGDHGYTLNVTGKKWDTGQVGFFRVAEGAETAPPEPVVRDIPAFSTTGNTETAHVFGVPDEVADHEAWWYLRVRKDATSQWSPVNGGALDRAQRFKVGNPEVIPGCAADASDQGNFGMISLPQQESYSDEDEVAWNIAAGLDEPMSLRVHPNGFADGGACHEFPTPDPAGSNEAGATNGTPAPEAKVNCVSTITGLFKGVEEGLIQGPASGTPGLLDAHEHPTKSGCGSDFTVDMQDGGEYTLNGESIDCYLDSGLSWGTVQSQIADDAYTGPAVFDPAIFKSPRFGYVPVFTGITNGHDTRAIVGFQAAFITDNPFYHNDDSTPGLYFKANGSGDLTLKSVTMFLFSRNALPDPPDDVPLLDYLGVGDPIVHLID